MPNHCGWCARSGISELDSLMKHSIIIRKSASNDSVVIKDASGTPRTFDMAPLNVRERHHVRRSLVNHWCAKNERPIHFQMGEDG